MCKNQPNKLSISSQRYFNGIIRFIFREVPTRISTIILSRFFRIKSTFWREIYRVSSRILGSRYRHQFRWALSFSPRAHAATPTFFISKTWQIMKSLHQYTSSTNLFQCTDIFALFTTVVHTYTYILRSMAFLTL